MLAHAADGAFPMPLWLFVYGVAFAVVLAALATRSLWPAPRLERSAVGVAVPSWLDSAAHWAGAVFGVVVAVVFAVTLAAAWFGVRSVAANIAPTALFVAFWVGVPVLSAVVGDVWRVANPLWWIARALDRLAGSGRRARRARGLWASHWPAAAVLFAFVWTELAYHDPHSVYSTGMFLGVYTAALLVGAGWFGSDWLRTADGFAVFFALAASLAPLHRVDGDLRWRWPGSGVADVEVRDGTLGVLAVVCGAVGFDSLAWSSFWLDILRNRTPWELTTINTLGLVMCIALVVAVFTVVTRAVAVVADEDDATSQAATDRWTAVLIPVTLGLFAAHHLDRLTVDGQAMWSMISDPFGRDWDLFGTADRLIDPQLVSAHQTAWIQVAIVTAAHVLAVIAVHDRAVARYPLRTALRARLPLLGLVLAAAVGGALMLG